MMPTPIQAAAVAALGDDAHVAAAAGAVRGTARADALGVSPTHGLVHDGGPAPFYLWLRPRMPADDGWELAARLAEAGTLVAPGSLYGPAGADHVRLALTQPFDRLELVISRLAESAART